MWAHEEYASGQPSTASRLQRVVAWTLILALAQSVQAGYTDVSPGGAIAINHVLNNNMNNSIPNTSVSLTPDGYGRYELSGTLFGYPISPPIWLKIGDDSWLNTSNSDGGVTYHNGLGGVYRIVIWEGLLFHGDLARVLVHELIHAYLAKNYPGFAGDGECQGCEHQYVHAVTAAAMCAMAQNCSLSAQERMKAQQLANTDSENCASLAGAMACNDCSQVKPEPFPSCPGPCDLPECN